MNSLQTLQHFAQTTDTADTADTDSEAVLLASAVHSVLVTSPDLTCLPCVLFRRMCSDHTSYDISHAAVEL